ncbi:MAG: trigger factor family protein, partial [Endomicrobia bacterium]|nr:trigger factor family protein [Endomicrobiia bacterium]
MKQIDVNITKLTQCKLKLKVTLQKSLVEQIYTNCCLELQKEVQLPGFRKGTVPINLLKAKFPQKLNTKFVQKVITDTLSDIVKTHNIKYLPESLEVTSTDLKPDDTSSYEVVLETEPQVKLNHYKGLKLKKEIRRVTQNDI